MKRFLLRSFSLLLILILVDQSLGAIIAHLYKILPCEEKLGYLSNKSEHHDVLIFGSSRALHHYNPKVLEDSLGMNCYNCGTGGMGILYHYALLSLALEHDKPSMVILDLNPDFDLVDLEDNHKYLLWLKAYYDIQIIKDIVLDVDSLERYKMYSKLYRYNSIINSMLKNSLSSQGDAKTYHGFSPMKLQFNEEKVVYGDRMHNYCLDSLKLLYLNKFLEKAKECKTVVCISPRWYGMDPFYVGVAEEICNKHNIPFLNFSSDKGFVKQNTYFCDGTHMNNIGADIFSKELVASLKILCK